MAKYKHVQDILAESGFIKTNETAIGFYKIGSLVRETDYPEHIYMVLEIYKRNDQYKIIICNIKLLEWYYLSTDNNYVEFFI